MRQKVDSPERVQEGGSPVGLRSIRLKLIDTRGGRLLTWREARALI